jgi:transposase-like protein
MSKVRNSPYRGHRFPAEVIAQAIWLYFRFPLGLGLAEDPPERSFAKANGGFCLRKHGKTK